MPVGAFSRAASSNVQSTGIHRGKNCPAGQVKIGRTRSIFQAGKMGRRYETECGIPVAAPAPAPRPAPAPAPARINVQTQINPNFQQSFTPQVSPVIQTGQGHSGGTQQNASVPQSGTQSDPATQALLKELLSQRNQQPKESASDIMRIMMEQQERARIVREREEREAAAKTEEARQAQELAKYQEAETRRSQEAFAHRQEMEAMMVEQQAQLDQAPASNTQIVPMPMYAPGAPAQSSVSTPSTEQPAQSSPMVDNLPLYVGLGLLVVGGAAIALSKKGKK